MVSRFSRNGVWTYSGSRRILLSRVLPAFFLLAALSGGAFAGTLYLGATPYGSFQSAYAAASTGAVLKAQPMVYLEGLFLNRALGVTLQGGYDPVAGIVTGFTTMNGPLTVGSGSVIVGNMVITGINASVFVPNVTGQPLSAAQSALAAAGVTVGAVTTQQSAAVTLNNLISQNPGAGAYVVAGSNVNLVVSLGAASVTVPTVIGLTATAAQSALSLAGLTTGSTTLLNNNTVASGVVLGQSPPANGSIPAGTAVNLIISSGPVSGVRASPTITSLPVAETTPGALVGVSYVVFAWNDLGMHCLNPSYDTAVILPPYNTVRAQVVMRGNKPTVVTSGLTVSYRIINNTTSQKGLFKQFWTYALQLFGAAPAMDHGLNLDDPTVSNGLTGVMLAKSDTITATPYFIAGGIPVTPMNDDGSWNPYQLAEITVTGSATGATLARTRVTIPTSDEISCGKCHGNSSDPTVVFNDILAKHDRRNNTTLLFSKPVRCSSCHGSPVLKAPLQPGIKYLSEAIHGFHGALATPPNCYDCHPGVVTQCNRSTKHTSADGNCTTCHGALATVGSSITAGRVPWVTEPKCVTCHNTNVSNTAGIAQVDTGAVLYRNSVGHSGLFCSACHGGPHSMTPSNQVSDNYQTLQYQGKAVTMGDCRVCHPTSRGGGAAAQFAGQHLSNASACNVCHTGFQNASNTANWPHQFQWKSR